MMEGRDRAWNSSGIRPPRFLLKDTWVERAGCLCTGLQIPLGCQSVWFLKRKNGGKKKNIWIFTCSYMRKMVTADPQDAEYWRNRRGDFPGYTCFRWERFWESCAFFLETDRKECCKVVLHQSMWFSHILLWTSQDFCTYKNILEGRPRNLNLSSDFSSH